MARSLKYNEHDKKRELSGWFSPSLKESLENLASPSIIKQIVDPEWHQQLSCDHKDKQLPDEASLRMIQERQKDVDRKANGKHQ